MKITIPLHNRQFLLFIMMIIGGFISVTGCINSHKISSTTKIAYYKKNEQSGSYTKIDSPPFAITGIPKFAEIIDVPIEVRLSPIDVVLKFKPNMQDKEIMTPPSSYKDTIKSDYFAVIVKLKDSVSTNVLIGTYYFKFLQPDEPLPTKPPKKLPKGFILCRMNYFQKEEHQQKYDSLNEIGAPFIVHASIFRNEILNVPIYFKILSPTKARFNWTINNKKFEDTLIAKSLLWEEFRNSSNGKFPRQVENEYFGLDMDIAGKIPSEKMNMDYCLVFTK